MSSFQTSNFNFKLTDPRQKTLKECKAYIREYFVPLRDGNHAVLEDGKYELKDEATLKKFISIECQFILLVVKTHIPLRTL